MTNVKTGQCLSSVVDDKKKSATLKHSSSTYSIKKVRKKAQARALKLSRSLSTLDQKVTKTVVIKKSPRSVINMLGQSSDTPNNREVEVVSQSSALSSVPAEIAIRSEFASKEDQTILHYGSTVSLEIFTGDFLMVSSRALLTEKC